MTHRDPSSSTPTPLRPCDLFSEEIHLLVDGELGAAERDLVEAHLSTCPRCLALATQLERMSSVLKAWDHRANDVPVPAPRVQRGVLARVAETGALRRRDDRVVRLVQLATAAVVVLGLGLAVLLGSRAAPESAHETAREVPTPRDPDAPWPLEARRPSVAALPEEPFEDRLTAADLLAGIELPEPPALAGDPGLVRDEDMAVFTTDPAERAALATLDMRIEVLASFADRLGIQAMYWNGPHAAGAEARMLPQRTYRWLRDTGILTRWRDSAIPTSPTVAGAGATDTPRASVATGVLAKDMLAPMPGITSPLRLVPGDRLAWLPGMHPLAKARTKSGKVRSTRGLPPLVEIRAIPDPQANALTSLPGLRSGLRGGASTSDFLDPLDAWANGQLRFAESQHDAGRIVAFVKGTTKPIFLPAGQFVTDGHGDRIVRDPTWLPASRGETPHIIRCVVVQAMPNVEARGVPQLSPHVAGPSIRALLAHGADQAEIKRAARALCVAHHEVFGAAFSEWRWSLRSVYAAAPGSRDGADAFARVAWQGADGFVATDGAGRLVGFELVRAHGPAAEALLGRLWRGYALEALWRIQSPALAEAFATPRGPADRILGRLAAHPAGFRIPADVQTPAGSTVSTLDVADLGLALSALEVGERPTVVSGLIRP